MLSSANLHPYNEGPVKFIPGVALDTFNMRLNIFKRTNATEGGVNCTGNATNINATGDNATTGCAGNNSVRRCRLTSS